MQDLTPSKSLNQEHLLHSFIVIVFFLIYSLIVASRVMVPCRSARECLHDSCYGEMMPVGTAHSSWQQCRLV